MGTAEVAESVHVVGSVIRVDGRLAMVPTRPPYAHEQRWGLEEDGAGGFRLTAEPDGVADDESVLWLSGPEVPPLHQRVNVLATMAGRDLEVRSWQPEPYCTFDWFAPRTGPGVDEQTADTVMDDLLAQDFQVLAIGQGTLHDGSQQIHVAIDRVTPEIQSWLEAQPAHAVAVFAYITPA